ncbi:MAG: calcium-binding protein [Paracoccaceae bacterium]|nr:MAG: calcium-binding protein [Paracoccaceae bacterium]
MANFFITGTSTTTQSLTGSESGFVTLGSTLYSIASSPVTMTDTATLQVFGSVASGNAVGVTVAGGSNNSITVGAAGSITSGSSIAISGNFFNVFTLHNAGFISGRSGGVFLANTAGNTSNSAALIHNSGTIETSSVQPAIRTGTGANITLFLTNTGMIGSQGGVAAVQVGQGSLDMANTGAVFGNVLGGGLIDTVDNIGSIVGTVNLSTGDDILINSGTIHGLVDLGGGNDTLQNTGEIIGIVRGGNTETAGQGNDTILNDGRILGDIVAGAGDDVIRNTATIIGSVDMGSGNDTLRNSGTISGSVSMGVAESGSLGHDVIINTGLIDGDVLMGPGNDLFDGRGGQVTGIVYGGAGDDTYYIDDAAITISESSNQGFDTVYSSVSYSLTGNVERLILTGAAAGLVGTGNGSSNSITSEAFVGVTLRGLGGDDNVIGNSSGDLLFGGAGNDLILSGSNGSATLYGGAGNDTIYGNAEDGILTYGGAGNDVLVGGAGDDVLDGGAGSDVIYANSGNDSAFGGAGDDVIYYDTTFGSGSGAKLFNGGSGFDMVELFGHVAPFVANLQTGTGLDGAGNVQTFVSIEGLRGYTANDTLTGDNGANYLDGSYGDDVLSGGNGADTIVGGFGQDTMTGGGNPDVFVFNAIGESIAEAPDRITDFNRNQDFIDLSQIDADPLTGGDQAFVFIGINPFSGAGGEVRAVRSNQTGLTTIEVQLVGSEASDMVIVLDGVIAMLESNFIL